MSVLQLSVILSFCSAIFPVSHCNKTVWRIAEINESYIDSYNSNLTSIDDNKNVPTLYDNSEESRISYKGYQLWRVVLDNSNSDKVKEVVKLRDEKDLTMWGGNRSAIDVLVKGKSLPTVKNTLDKNNINFEVIIQDVQKAMDEENPQIEDDEFQNRQGHRMSWRSYHRLADIYGYLDYLAETYPSLCTVKVIGHSVQGKPIKVIKLSNGNSGNAAIWIDGGMHAREWISPATVTYILNHIVLKQERSFENVDFYILPIANPDGYEYSHNVDRLWRKNRARSGQCMGTDLNRNFGYKWGGKGSGKNPCRETYGGTSAFSEPETRAIQTFMTSENAEWKAYISFHSYGQYILFPWGYEQFVTTDYKDLQSVASKAASAIKAAGGPSYTVGPAGSTLYPASGGSDDWAKGAMKIKYSYTIELRDSGHYGFILPAHYIEPTAKEALAAVKVITTAAVAHK